MYMYMYMYMHRYIVGNLYIFIHDVTYTCCPIGTCYLVCSASLQTRTSSILRRSADKDTTMGLRTVQVPAGWFAEQIFAKLGKDEMIWPVFSSIILRCGVNQWWCRHHSAMLRLISALINL